MSLVTAGVMGWRHGGCRGGGAAWGEGSVRRRGGGGDEEHVSRSSIPYEDLAARPPPPRAAVAPCSVPFALTRGWNLRAGASNQPFCRVRLLVWLSLCFWVQIFITMIIRLRNFEMDTLCGGQCELIIIIFFFTETLNRNLHFLSMPQIWFHSSNQRISKVGLSAHTAFGFSRRKKRNRRQTFAPICPERFPTFILPAQVWGRQRLLHRWGVFAYFTREGFNIST